jgi:L-aminopeptidase/D-esterase-like protein
MCWDEMLAEPGPSARVSSVCIGLAVHPLRCWQQCVSRPRVLMPQVVEVLQGLLADELARKTSARHGRLGASQTCATAAAAGKVGSGAGATADEAAESTAAAASSDREAAAVPCAGCCVIC